MACSSSMGGIRASPLLLNGGIRVELDIILRAFARGYACCHTLDSLFAAEKGMGKDPLEHGGVYQAGIRGHQIPEMGGAAAMMAKDKDRFPDNSSLYLFGLAVVLPWSEYTVTAGHCRGKEGPRPIVGRNGSALSFEQSEPVGEQHTGEWGKNPLYQCLAC